MELRDDGKGNPGALTKQMACAPGPEASSLIGSECSGNPERISQRRRGNRSTSLLVHGERFTVFLEIWKENYAHQKLMELLILWREGEMSRKKSNSAH